MRKYVFLAAFLFLSGTGVSVWLLPTLIICGLMLGSFAMLLSSVIKQLENFAGIMNFVIFPMFFMSSALYPLWKMQESSNLLYQICVLNPFTYAVELIRFSLYVQFHVNAAAVVAMAFVVFFGLAIYAYNPVRGMVHRKGGPSA